MGDVEGKPSFQAHQELPFQNVILCPGFCIYFLWRGGGISFTPRSQAMHTPSLARGICQASGKDSGARKRESAGGRLRRSQAHRHPPPHPTPLQLSSMQDESDSRDAREESKGLQGTLRRPEKFTGARWPSAVMQGGWSQEKPATL